LLGDGEEPKLGRGAVDDVPRGARCGFELGRELGVGELDAEARAVAGEDVEEELADVKVG
jgi:hypothetical protein